MSEKVQFWCRLLVQMKFSRMYYACLIFLIIGLLGFRKLSLCMRVQYNDFLLAHRDSHTTHVPFLRMWLHYITVLWLHYSAVITHEISCWRIGISTPPMRYPCGACDYITLQCCDNFTVLVVIEIGVHKHWTTGWFWTK